SDHPLRRVRRSGARWPRLSTKLPPGAGQVKRDRVSYQQRAPDRDRGQGELASSAFPGVAERHCCGERREQVRRQVMIVRVEVIAAQATGQLTQRGHVLPGLVAVDETAGTRISDAGDQGAVDRTRQL